MFILLFQEMSLDELRFPIHLSTVLSNLCLLRDTVCSSSHESHSDDGRTEGMRVHFPHIVVKLFAYTLHDLSSVFISERL